MSMNRLLIKLKRRVNDYDIWDNVKRMNMVGGYYVGGGFVIHVAASIHIMRLKGRWIQCEGVGNSEEMKNLVKPLLIIAAKCSQGEAIATHAIFIADFNGSPSAECAVAA